MKAFFKQSKYLIIILFIIGSIGFKLAEYPQLKSKRFHKDIKKGFGITSFNIQKINSDIVNTPNGEFYLLKSNDSIFAYTYIGRVKTCRSGGCSINNKIDKGNDSEYFEYYIFFDTKMGINRLRVFNYQATHGHEITAQSWLRQFVGYTHQNQTTSGQSLTVGKNIDAISGATISVYAITYDIEHISKLIQSI